MIKFHEGLAGSGKSYEAVVKVIIPELQGGRQVFTNIAGLNYEKIAAVSGIELEKLNSLLIQLSDTDIPYVYDKVSDNSYVAIDELQDFFPVSRQPLSTPMTKFITQHRHRGIDILAMGQDHRDCHSLWKRRIDFLYKFLKLDGVGLTSYYNWDVYKNVKGEFHKLTAGRSQYDPKYFGTYKSHVDGVTAIDVNRDMRTNMFNSKYFRVFLPMLAACLVAAVWYLWGVFHGSGLSVAPVVQERPLTEKEALAIVKTSPLPPAPVSPAPPVPPPAPPPGPAEPPKAPEYSVYVDTMLQSYRPRLAALITSKSRPKPLAKVDFYQGDRVEATMSVQDLEEFGYKVEVKSFGLLISSGKKSYPVMSWPLDIRQNVPERIEPSLKQETPNIVDAMSVVEN